MKKLLTIILICLAASCAKQETQDDIISSEQFERIYVELLDSSAVGQQAQSDSTLTPIAERILRRNNVTEEQFRATIRYYNSDSKKWKGFYENVTNVYSERRAQKKETE